MHVRTVSSNELVPQVAGKLLPHHSGSSYYAPFDVYYVSQCCICRSLNVPICSWVVNLIQIMFDLGNKKVL